MTKKQIITDMEKLDQQLLFDSAFEYLNTNYKKVNLATCIQALQSDETPKEKRFVLDGQH